MSMRVEGEPLTIETASSPDLTQRIASVAAVINYLQKEGSISFSPDSRVLDLGTGSGVGVYVWRAFGVREENITAVDILWSTKPDLIGSSHFVNSGARQYLANLGQEKFDVVSAFRVPNNHTDFTGGAGQSWLELLSEALHDEKSFYLETRSEWGEYIHSAFGFCDSLSKECISFMGDELEVPDLPLLNAYQLPKKVMMGHSDGVFEENHNGLDGRKWIPCDRETGEPLQKVNPPDYPRWGWRYGPDEYGVWADHGPNGWKRYPFGKVKRIDFLFGYADNTAALYHKLPQKHPSSKSPPQIARTRSFSQKFLDLLRKI